MKRKTKLTLFGGWFIIGFLSLMIVPSFAPAVDKDQSQFILAAWSYPDEYGQGIESIYFQSNGTGSWVNLAGGYPAYNNNDTVFDLSIGEAVKLQVYVYLNRTHIGLPQPWNQGHDYIRLNVTVTTPAETVFSQQNFTYDGFGGTADQVEWYKYTVVLNFLTQEATTYTATVDYDIYYEDIHEGWTWVRGIPITGSSGAGTNYPIRLSIQADATTEVDFSDLRFYAQDNTTLLPAWKAWDDGQGQADIWVSVSANLNTSQTIFMYSGNPSASAYWDGPATFDFFDDFEDDSLNTTLWTEESSGGSYTETGGYLTVKGPSPERIISDYGFGDGYAFRMLNFTVTAKGVNKYLYAGAYNFGTVDFALFQSYNNVDRFITYDTGAEINNWSSNFTTETLVFEIRTLSDVKTEFARNNGVLYTHTTEETSTDKVFDFEVTGAGTGAGDYVKVDVALVRKCIDVEPNDGTWTSAVSYSDTSQWLLHTSIDNIIFPVDFSAATLWALDGWYMLLGAGLVVFSTTFGAIKLRDRSGSLDSVLIVVMCFLIGWALIIGMVI